MFNVFREYCRDQVVFGTLGMVQFPVIGQFVDSRMSSVLKITQVSIPFLIYKIHFKLYPVENQCWISMFDIMCWIFNRHSANIMYVNIQYETTCNGSL